MSAQLHRQRKVPKLIRQKLLQPIGPEFLRLPPRHRHLAQPLPGVLAILGSQPLERLGGASPPKLGQYACVPRGAVGRTLHTRGCGDVSRFRHTTAGLAQVVLPQGRSHALAAVARGLGALERTTPHKRHDTIGVLAGSLQAPIRLVRSPCILECHLQCVAASEPIVVVLVAFRWRDMCHQPTRACTRSLQLVLLQGDPHGAVPVRGDFVSLGHPNRCCNISNAPRGASTGDPQLLVPQQRHVARGDGGVKQTLPPPYLQALVGADFQKLHAMGSVKERIT